jgi:2-polyprenyl-3-methyl-5-hydroxy-6-metoxy-1,4-benzoquinol methylase
MTKNQNLQDFYDNVYKNDEKKHFTNLVIKGTVSEESHEIIKETSWKSKKVLDVGCGTGFFANSAAQKGANVLGIDFSEQAIKIAKKKYKKTNLKYKQMDVKDISEKYDIIVSIGTLEHMDEPLKILKLFKKHLNHKGKIIVTSPNWTNPRGYMLMTLLFLFDAPITLADLHYQTPIDFIKYSKKLNMSLKWRTIDKSWAHGDILIKDFIKRLPNVLRDTNLPCKSKNIKNLIDWIKNNVVAFDNSQPHSGATGLYVFSFKTKIK